jgi:hypothetical protein
VSDLLPLQTQPSFTKCFSDVVSMVDLVDPARIYGETVVIKLCLSNTKLKNVKISHTPYIFLYLTPGQWGSGFVFGVYFFSLQTFRSVVLALAVVAQGNARALDVFDQWPIHFSQDRFGCSEDLFCESALILYLLLCCLVRVVSKFYFRLVWNWTPNKLRPVEHEWCSERDL